MAKIRKNQVIKGRPNKAMGGSDDPSLWLCRKRNGSWWIWRPYEYLPVVERTNFPEALAWRPPDGNYL